MNFFFSTLSTRALGVHSTSYSMDIGGSFPVVKRPEREADHSYPTSDSIHPLPHTPSWRSAYLVRHRDNFTILFMYDLCNDGFSNADNTATIDRT
jgi:hypothetical protein